MMYTSSTSVGQRTKPTCNAAAALTRAATRHQSAPHSTTQHHKAPHTQHDTRLERRHATRTDGRERGVPARDPPPPQDSPRAHTAQHASHAAPPTALYWGGHGAHIVSKMPRGALARSALPRTPHLPLPDASSCFFFCSRLSLACSSICFLISSAVFILRDAVSGA